MRVTASQLRADIYNLLDRAVSGEPLEIERGGVVLRVVAPRGHDWLDRLPRREGVVTGDPDDLVSMDWSGSWDPGP